jgi:small GTP-binding protein
MDDPMEIHEPERTPLRIVLIGNSSVGKTSLINKFMYDTFDLNQPNSVGAYFLTHKYSLPGSSGCVDLQIWDTVGQERFKSVGSTYYRGADGALAVFDATNHESFGTIGPWISAFREVTGSSSIVVMAGNKIDLLGSKPGFMEEAAEYCKEDGFKLVWTSAMTGQGVQEAFEELIMESIAHRTQSRELESVLNVKVDPWHHPCNC